MKKLLTLATIIFANFGNALSLEIVPLQLRAGVEVMGVQAEVDGSQAIIFAGETAYEIAQAAGMTINTATHGIVATGYEVSRLVSRSLNGVRTVGRTALITSANFAYDALHLAYHGIERGVSLVRPAIEGISFVARSALNGLHAATRSAVVLVADTGVRVFRTGANIIGNLISIPLNLLGIFGK